MVKSSKPSSESWLASSTVSTTLYSKAMSAPKHRASSSQLAENSNASRRPDDRAAGHPKEEPVLDDAGDRVDGGAEGGVDGAEAGVEDQVAVVAPKRYPGGHAELGPPAERLDGPAGGFPEERQDLDRQGPPAQGGHQLALLCGQDESPSRVA